MVSTLIEARPSFTIHSLLAEASDDYM